MSVTFSYDIERDVENFLKSYRSVNNKAKTKFMLAYEEKHGDDLRSESVRSFIQEHLRSSGIDTKDEAVRLGRGWQIIEAEFLKRAEHIFGVTLGDATAYLSTNSRCTYSVEGNYFFVHIGNRSPNVTVMHELWHFFTHRRFDSLFVQRAVSPQLRNDIKESLTELLNVECKDLLADAQDKGYPQHAALRARIRGLWAESRDVSTLVERLIEENT